MGSWCGTVRVSTPLGPLRCIFMCFVPVATTKPKYSKMPTTSEPERTLSPPRIGLGGNLEVGQDRGQTLEAEQSEVFVFEIDGNDIADILLQLLERCTLGSNGDVHGRGDVHAVLLPNIEMDSRSH